MPASDVLNPGDPLYLPDDAGWLTRAKVALRAFFVLAEDQAHGIAAPVLNLSVDAEVYQRIAAKMAETDEGREILAERPNLQAGAIDIRELEQLPEGTLGKALARYYVENRIAPFASPYPVSTDIEYLAKRYREVHDVLHIISEYGTDPMSELELQAFVVGNIGLRHPLVILTMTALLMPMGLPPIWTYFHKLRAAYQRGRRSRNVAVQPRYERYWTWKVEDVRRQVGVAPRA